jgi:LPS-assembly protein
VSSKLVLAVLAFAATVRHACAQAGAFHDIGYGLGVFNQSPQPFQPNPLQPKGFPEPPAKVLPEPPRSQPTLPGAPPLDPNRLNILHAGTIERKGDVSRLTAGVELVYRGYHVFGDIATWDDLTHIANLNGHVKILTGETVVTGAQVIVDFDQRTFRSFDSVAQVDPKLVGGQLRGMLYINGHEAFGGQEEYRSYVGDLTTCNLEHPHYDIEGEDVVVRPGLRAIFRRAKIRLFGRTILRLPFLSIPLDDRTYDNMPLVGHSPDEGYFIKTHWAIPLRGRNELQLRLDEMTRLGVGYGANYMYQQKNLQGYFKFYSIEGPGYMLQVTNEHVQQFKWGKLTVDMDYENNNYLTSPGVVLFTGKVMLEVPQKGGIERFSYSRSSQQSQGYSSSTQDLTYSESTMIGKHTQVSFSADYNETINDSQGNNSSQQQLDVTFKAVQDTPKGTGTFDYQREIPIGSVPAFYGGSDETPEVTFTSDSTKIFGKHFAFPFQAEAALGDFQDMTGSHISREEVEMTFAKTDTSKKRLHFDYNGEFKQGFYSDDTAEYILAVGGVLSYKIGSATTANLRYNYLRPYGYSPLPIDQTGETNLATVDVSQRILPGLQMGGQTGYDIYRLDQRLGSPWEAVALRTEYAPTHYILFRSLANYDTLEGEWDSLRMDFGYKPGATTLAIGTQYDGIRKVWSIVNFELIDFTVGKAKISANFSYDGYTNQFDSTQVNVIYDLHCAEAVLTYSDFETGFRPGRSVELFIRIKAFPFNSAFGIGQRGQPLGVGTGNGF